LIDPISLIKKQIAIQQCYLDGIRAIVKIMELNYSDYAKEIAIVISKATTQAQVDIIRSQPARTIDDK